MHNLRQISELQWQLDPIDEMRVPAIVFADKTLMDAMDEKVFQQLKNVASLPGVVQAVYAMPDAHWGYGFPIGGVAAFDPNDQGVVSAGGVGFDISCGVRTLRTGLKRTDIEPIKNKLADALQRNIPAGVGRGGHLQLNDKEIDKMLVKGAHWALSRGFGIEEDLVYTEDNGIAEGAVPNYVSEKAKLRQAGEMGSLGSGNHYLEMQEVSEIYDARLARLFDLEIGDIVISMHCGSRGLGHQIATDYLREMTLEANKQGIHFAERELASAPIESQLGQRYLGAMRAGINCALANRQILTQLVRDTMAQFCEAAQISVLYDVSHNTCKEETYTIEGQKKKLFVHRKGATRAFGPQHPELPEKYMTAGQPVLIGGSMGTSSYILVGTTESEKLSFHSSCHGAGRSLSRHQASKRWQGHALVEELARKNIIIRSHSYRGVAEEAPLAYKDVTTVVDVAEKSGISRKVAKLVPVICIKG